MRAWSAVVVAGLFVADARDARAEAHAALPASGGLSAVDVRVDAAARAAHVVAGATRVDVPIELPEGLAIDAADVEAAPVAIGLGKSAVHVRVGAKPVEPRGGEGRDVAWEALVVGRDPPVAWSGVTGFARGEEGEYTGTAVEVGAGFVVVGDVRQDLGICGEEQTLLDPKALDPKTLAFHGVTMQRLDPERRAKAERVVASAHGGPADPPLARLLVATGASSGAHAALTDGDPATAWSEGRSGDGHGEFVQINAPPDVPVARFAVTIAPPSPPAHGAAPRSFYLVTDARVIEVTLPEDAWMHPGAAYDVPLADPVRTSCLSLVLDKSYERKGEPHPEVTVAELTAYSAFDGPSATLDDVARALAGGGARANAAKAILERAGDGGLAAAARAYPGLDASGRALAIDAAIGAGTCEASAPLLLAAMGDADPAVARKGREKIERCGKRATAGLVGALRGADMTARANAARLLASIAPGEALAPLVASLADGPRETRAAVRASLAKSVERAATAAQVAAWLADASRPADAQLDLLRALGDRLAGARREADAAIERLLPGAPMRTRYLLVEPMAKLAAAGDEADARRLRDAMLHDADPAVRANAAAGAPADADALVAALRDASPRVRLAALGSLQRLAAARAIALRDASPIAERLAKDDWTFVRAAAAGALDTVPDAEGVLVDALEDRAPSVREAAIASLASRSPSKRAVAAIEARLADAREAPAVRLAAVNAVTVACDAGALDALTKLASRAADVDAVDDDVSLGLHAADALGALHPADLERRLRPLQSAARADVKGAAARALATPGRCR